MESTSFQERLRENQKLPDNIIRAIISLLPVDEMARTSVLATNWRHSWRTSTRINFDSRSMTEYWRDFPLELIPAEVSSDPIFLSEFLSAEQVSDVEEEMIDADSLITPILFDCGDLITCRITHFRTSLENVEGWVNLTKAKGVQELFLTCRQEIYSPLHVLPMLNLAPRIFSCETLRVIELANYVLRSSSPFTDCNNLQSLKLQKVLVGQRIILDILGCCNFLKRLSLLSCVGISNLQIHSRSLEFLELRGLEVSSLSISAEALSVFMLDSVNCPPGRLHVEAPNVDSFLAYYKHNGYRIGDPLKPAELLARCSGMLRSGREVRHQVSQKTSYISPFKMLQTLSTSLDLNNIREAAILAYIFQVCPYLEKLNISIPVEGTAMLGPPSGSSLPYTYQLFWDKKEAFDSVSTSLKKVTISGFCGQVLELAFTKYIVTMATKLKRVSIFLHPLYGIDEAEAILLSIPRAALDVSIDIRPCSSSIAQ